MRSAASLWLLGDKGQKCQAAAIPLYQLPRHEKEKRLEEGCLFAEGRSRKPISPGPQVLLLLLSFFLFFFKKKPLCVSCSPSCLPCLHNAAFVNSYINIYNSKPVQFLGQRALLPDRAWRLCHKDQRLPALQAELHGGGGGREGGREGLRLWTLQQDFGMEQPGYRKEMDCKLLLKQAGKGLQKCVPESAKIFPPQTHPHHTYVQDGQTANRAFQIML